MHLQSQYFYSEVENREGNHFEAQMQPAKQILKKKNPALKTRLAGVGGRRGNLLLKVTFWLHMRAMACAHPHTHTRTVAGIGLILLLKVEYIWSDLSQICIL